MIRAMKMLAGNTYNTMPKGRLPIPNYWDGIALLLVLAMISLLGLGAKSMLGNYHLGQVIPISLKPICLPDYALHSVMRMIIALIFSLLFTFMFGTWAAKSRQAEKLIIPLIDILQSVPVLGFLSISVVGFIALFSGSMLGPECAAILAIFAAQAWNMALSFYQSLRMVPEDLVEAAQMFQLSPWQRYWKIEVPFAMPSLLWNAMISMSGSWVFLVAAEAITVAHYHITLPGIGSYIALAIQKANKASMVYAIIAMLVVIVLYDQLLFRPLVAWAEKFKTEEAASEIYPQSWLLNLFQRTRFFRFLGIALSYIREQLINAPWLNQQFKKRSKYSPSLGKNWTSMVWNLALGLILSMMAFFLLDYLHHAVSLKDGVHIIFLGFVTALRVMLLILISSLIWVPIGVWIGMRARVMQYVQPMLQFFAAFPANLLFPIAVLLIIRYHLNVTIWCSPLMILGTQWYILFNVIAGTASIPKNLHHAVETLCVSGFSRWRRFLLPAIFPFYVTGAITAAGGAWNISIIAEALSWGDRHLYAVGLGAYIDQVYTLGDFPHLTLGIVVMSLYVLVINRMIWRPLYNIADQRFRMK